MTAKQKAEKKEGTEAKKNESEKDVGKRNREASQEDEMNKGEAQRGMRRAKGEGTGN